eukprot:TRINITY_DN3137_c0_g1_i7.p1 TRINITY_DN3137_c0_g1~~TRINITY_DN3137_c0_g1_i7.p1  ORF type:complete len:185 (-),score=43.68 TRINITY_DN3137_c0_g1_i7:221-775(-)
MCIRDRHTGGGGYSKPAASSAAGANANPGSGYAKQPRQAVDYTPYTMADYKANCQPGKWEKLGKLGPDMQDEGLLNKRAQKERLKDYSVKLRQYNAAAVESDVFARPSTIKKEGPKPKSKREMAIEYAARVPKPKAKKKPAEDEWDDEVEFAELGPVSELQMLESKHKADQEAVENIRRQLGMR